MAYLLTEAEVAAEIQSRVDGLGVNVQKAEGAPAYEILVYGDGYRAKYLISWRLLTEEDTARQLDQAARRLVCFWAMARHYRPLQEGGADANPV